jgi:hypothetical protein
MSKKVVKKPLHLFSEIFGWYGALAILGAYALVSFSIITGDGLIFQLLNLTGGFGLLAIAYYKKVYQSVVLNIVWSIIGILAIINIIF